MFVTSLGLSAIVALAASAPPLPAQQSAPSADAISKLTAEVKLLAAEVAKSRLQARERELRLIDAQRQIAKLQQQRNAETAELQNRLKAMEAGLGKDAKNLLQLLAARDKTIFVLQDNVKEFRKKALANEQLARALRNHNEQLLRDVQALSAQLAKVGAAPPLDSKPPLAVNPPKNMVKGKIQRIDPNNGNLVTISLGKDHGISVNNTLEVFRTEPEPKYLGLVRIIAVNTDTCVGRLILPPGTTKRQKLLVGDHAWSKLSK